MKTLLLSLILAIFAQDVAYGQLGVDRTREVEAAGTDVVFSTILLIRDAGIFPVDNRFLRRLAYVESRDGVAIGTFRDGYNGGIWQVDENRFNATIITDPVSNPELSAFYTLILNAFGIDWAVVKWEELRIPLFSALAARLYLTTVPASIPAAGDLNGQGEYWQNRYSNNPTVDTAQVFVDSVNEFELEGKCNCIAYKRYACCTKSITVSICHELQQESALVYFWL